MCYSVFSQICSSWSSCKHKPSMAVLDNILCAVAKETCTRVQMNRNGIFCLKTEHHEMCATVCFDAYVKQVSENSSVCTCHSFQTGLSDMLQDSISQCRLLQSFHALLNIGKTVLTLKINLAQFFVNFFPAFLLQRFTPHSDIKTYISRAHSATDVKTKFDILEEIIKEFPANIVS